MTYTKDEIKIARIEMVANGYLSARQAQIFTDEMIASEIPHFDKYMTVRA